MMSPKQIFYIAIACLILILGTQAYLVNDYYQTTRASLVRESNAILDEAFKKELDVRSHALNQRIDKHKVDTISTTGSNSTKDIDRVNKTYDYDKMGVNKSDVVSLINLAIHDYTSKFIPLNLHMLDSITATVLHARNINSDFNLVILAVNDGRVIQQSKKELKSSVFCIQSKNLALDVENKKVLNLTLINPFGIILKRMGLMLVSSFFLSLICFLAFGFLLRILSRQKQLVTFKNEFLATIAHELKRPVASLSFNLDSLKMPAIIETPATRDKLIDRSIYATTELNATINMIVALSKVEEGMLTLNKTPINLKHLFEELKHRFITEASKQVRIELQCDDGEELSCSGDVQLLSQCFANLIDNAIKYSENEVLIVISLHKSGSWVVISIKDNGMGIPDEKLPMIFDKYVRVHTNERPINGFGIGLNYVKTIVEEHQGEVKVSSVVGKGSEFRVMLPKIINN